MTIADQQPIKGSPKAKAMEPGKGSETKRSFSGNGEDDIVHKRRVGRAGRIVHNKVRRVRIRYYYQRGCMSALLLRRSHDGTH